ncbi:MAG: ATP-binding cassette domain-containing protein [candidate division FCPU426 bacterium]
MDRPVIRTFDLTKRFGVVRAVEQVNISVAPGEIYGFLGLNGAGKSTTIRMLLGMIRPTGGRVELFGEPVTARTSALWRRVGHLVETPTGYGELTVREDLRTSLWLQGLEDRRPLERVLGLLGLESQAGRRVKTLSLGNRQRLSLARALLGEPELLVLDEPANALDPAGVVEIRELLRGLARDQGVTIFMSSHILAEVDRLATRIGVIHQGRLIEELDADELEQRRQQRLEIESADLDAAERALRGAGFGQLGLKTDGGRRWLAVSDPQAIEHPEEAARVLVQAGQPPRRLAVEQEDLEQHFLRLVREKGGGAA